MRKIILLITALTLSACATLDKHSAIVELAVSQAAMRYIEEAHPTNRVDRARKVLSTIKQIRTVASGEGITITQLASIALAAIPSDLGPADRALALSVVNIASQELRNKLGDEVLTSDKMTQVLGVLNSIENAARIYTGS